MLYALHEMQHALLAPWNVWAKTHHELFSHPFSPLAYSPGAKRVAASADLMHRLTKRYDKPEFGLDHTIIDGAEVALTERVAVSKPFCRLLHFERAATRNDPVVLLVAPLSGHFATLLRDTVRAFAARPRGLRHRLGGREAGADLAGRVPPRRLRRLRARVHPPSRAVGARDIGLPADGAGARGGGADGGRRRGGAAAHDDDDGRADRRAPQPDRGHQSRAQASAVVVRPPPDRARAARSIPASCAASIPASCSTPDSWR